MSETEKCPWCKKDIDTGDFELYEDDATIEEMCPHCDKKIEITCHLTRYYTIESLGCEKHKLEVSCFIFIPKNEKKEDYVLEFKCLLCSFRLYDWQLPGGKYPKIKSGNYEFFGRALDIAKERGLTT